MLDLSERALAVAMAEVWGRNSEGLLATGFRIEVVGAGGGRHGCQVDTGVHKKAVDFGGVNVRSLL